MATTSDEWAIQNDPMRIYRLKRDATHASVASKYSILGFISSGTYGRVYKAQSLGDDARIHAIKKFKPDKEGDVVTYTGISQSAIREIALNREIDHENIVALKEVILEDKSIYMVFEFAEHDFLQVIQHHATALRTPITLPVLKSLIYQLLNGLVYLHSCHILHRDLKPANILITASGIVKIGDLGLARLIYQPLQPLFAGDKVVVTIWYRAPELLLGAKHYHKAIDCWAVGCVMAELASLRPIFKGEEAKLDSKKNLLGPRTACLAPFYLRTLNFTVLAEQEWPGVKDMPEYQSMKRLDHFTNRLFDWCQTRVRSQNGFDLLRQLFAYDPDTRLTAKEALQHKWFHEDPYPTWNAFAAAPQQIPPHRRITQDEAPSMVPMPAAPFNAHSQSKPGSSATLFARCDGARARMSQIVILCILLPSLQQRRVCLMVYLPPPQHASASRPSYGHAYANILRAHRQSPLTSAASVIMLVAPDVDALCAARMLAELFKHDDVMYRIIPVSGVTELEHVRDELSVATELRTLILLNMGAILDLPSEEWFGEFSTNMSVHVIDSARPQNLSSLFGAGEAGERIIVWDDGAAADLEEERKAWEALTYEPHPDSDDSDSDEDDEEVEEDEEDYEQTSGKRRSLGDGERAGGKRRRVDRPRRMTREDHEIYSERLEKYYMGGTWHGQSAAGTIYLLATVLERVDNELLWLAILGLTYQYTTARISRQQYNDLHSVYYDEVYRLNPQPLEEDVLTPDDLTVRATDELRFTLFRHWTLYDAMLHSSYVASKLGIWKERGRKKLTGLLAKMGFSLQQTQEQYALMDKDLKQTLVVKLDEIAPEYGLVELKYPSFRRCFGYRSQPMSAADAVEGISALLDVAGGIRLEVEVEGARRGGEWFGGGKLWEAPTNGRDNRRRREERENIPPGGPQTNGGDAAKSKRVGEGEEMDGEEETDSKELQWWVKNFWTSFDALTNIDSLRRALNLSMTVHRAIIDQGTSIIDKQDIRTMRNHRVVVLSQGPHLALFSHPGILSRLAMWLVDALRDRVPGTTLSSRTKKGSLPFVVACLNETAQTYMVVGVMASLDFHQVRKNEFGLAFLDAKERCNARTRHGSFDTSVLEINQDDLKTFLETLCESRDA
ncbi:Cell division control protein 45 [Mycena indigotica]|uniref:Cyclin-dependent kinase 8 n=1 Tax=Mycena indigotica TaxID=2126181 RepID=A0A8H6W0X1_9AGAR|nr:Cell division control protein 45 [Mycena indigotica]KAF7295344.1 Cell division control protein 45 [Mycena indigotica]